MEISSGRGRPRQVSAAVAEEAAPSGLVVTDIGKSFRGRAVVRNVSLSLKRGEVAGLLGPNGAGKTTCFYMITGLIPVDYGRIFLDGLEITAQPMFQRARMGLGYLPQETSIFRGMNVGDNVMAVVELREKDHKKAKAKVHELLAELHIDHLENHPPGLCQAASAAAWKSPGLWPRTRPLSCWTSLSPGSIPWPSRISAR